MGLDLGLLKKHLDSFADEFKLKIIKEVGELADNSSSINDFKSNLEVPFTNNQAERDIQLAKIKQKMNGGFRSSNGTENYCRINSFISTLRKLNRQVFQELLLAIKGNPFEIYPT